MRKIKIIGDIIPDKKLGNKVIWKSKNGDLLEDFTIYCMRHNGERFWQALRNWSKASAIYYQKDGSPLLDTDIQDTFYFEDIDK